MYYRKDSSRFMFYIIISSLIHLGIIMFFTMGNYSVLGGKGETRHDFEFVQVVEFKNEVRHVKPETTIKPERKDNRQEKPAKDENIENNEKIAETETEEQPVNNKTSESKSREENSITDKNSVKDNHNKNPEKTDIDDNVKQQNEVKDSIDSPETRNDKSSKGNKNNEIISSEKSDMEVKVNEENSSGKKSNSRAESENTESEKSKPEPPPPPTAGDLIAFSPQPYYPKDLVSQALSGVVELEVSISTNGEIENVVLSKSSGIEQMDRNAQLTIKRGWKFNPYKKPYTIKVMIEYKVDEKGNSSVNVKLGELVFK
ncbi:TonB family protein [Halothermothrix orenii H 168]|uniref:TonB family protein n=2 Tax=Halothermothrix orenii TaxID=31909 RepID=B8CXB0_HALOH|nr:TonB family protein [Halothermothrix orenii H 168]